MHQQVIVSGINTITMKNNPRQWVLPTLVVGIFQILVMGLILVHIALTLDDGHFPKKKLQ